MRIVGRHLHALKPLALDALEFGELSISLYIWQAFCVVVVGAGGACAGLLVVVWWWFSFIFKACYIEPFGVRRAVNDSACLTELYSF